MKKRFVVLIIVPAVLFLGLTYPTNKSWKMEKSSELFIHEYAASTQIVSYKNDIQPIWNKYCVECHNKTGGESPILISGESYENIVPEFITTYNVSQSLVYVQVNSGNMPDGKARIPQEQINTILRWLKQGYPNN